jgi:hypothetical protein
MEMETGGRTRWANNPCTIATFQTVNSVCASQQQQQQQHHHQQRTKAWTHLYTIINVNAEKNEMNRNNAEFVRSEHDWSLQAYNAYLIRAPPIESTGTVSAMILDTW